MGCTTASIPTLGLLGGIQQHFLPLDRLRKTARLNQKQRGTGGSQPKPGPGLQALLWRKTTKNHFISVCCCRGICSMQGAERAGPYVHKEWRGLGLKGGNCNLAACCLKTPWLTLLNLLWGMDGCNASGKGVLVAAGLRGLHKTLLVSKEDLRKRSCRDAKDRVSSSLPSPSQDGPEEEEVVKAFSLGIQLHHCPATPGWRRKASSSCLTQR